MNKKLVAFLLSTGILVSTCGTAFANEVAVDQPVETVNTPAPPINNVVNTEDQVGNDTVNIPAPPVENIEKPLTSEVEQNINKLTKIIKDMEAVVVKDDKELDELDKMTNEFIEKFKKETDKYNRELIINDFNKTTGNFLDNHDYNSKMKEVNKLYNEGLAIIDYGINNYEGQEFTKICNLSNELHRIFNDKMDLAMKHSDNISYKYDECHIKFNKVVKEFGMTNKEVNKIAEELKELCKSLDSTLMKKDMDSALLRAKESLEKLAKDVKTNSNIDGNKQLDIIKDKTKVEMTDIYDKYTKEYKGILDKIDQNIKDGTVMYHEIEECYTILDKYERQIKADKVIADNEYDKLFKEYETIMSNVKNTTTDTTSTVSESGSKMGSSSGGTSTSYSSTGTKSPKTGDYTTLGASIATMIAGIAGIFVSRKR